MHFLVVGSINMDYVVQVEHHPTPGETILADTMKLIPGGKGANQAYTLGRLGANIKMLGSVGQDSDGERLLSNLQAAGVDTRAILVDKESHSGVALITVSRGGQNEITVVSGANRLVTPQYIEENRQSIAWADIILLQLEIPLETVEYVIRLGHSLGKTIVLDPAPANADLPQELLQYVDYCKPNETELQQLLGKKLTQDNLPALARELVEKGVKNVIVTLGEKGVFFYNKEHSYLVEAVPVSVVDTTAAGDAFLASFCYFLAQEQDVKKSIEQANRFSSLVVAKAGAQDSIPSLQEYTDKFR